MFPKSCVALSFLLLFLAFSSLSLSLAVPSTRSLKSTEQDPLSSSSSLQDFLTHQVQEQDAVELKEGEVSFGKTFVISGRMDLESLDYPGTGANNHHDPKTPGRA